MSEHKNHAYLFDYGGTLDTGGHHWGRVLWHAWQAAGAAVSEEQFRQAYVYAERALDKAGIITPETSFRETLSIKLRIEMEQAGCMEWHEEVLNRVYEATLRHTAYSREVLVQLAEHTPIVLVSNFYGNLHTVIREMGLEGLFMHVVESAAVGVRKPSPQIFQQALDRLGLLPQQVTVVGDSIHNDIAPAKALGCHTVWLRGEQWSDGSVDEGLPDRIINNLTELLR